MTYKVIATRILPLILFSAALNLPAADLNISFGMFGPPSSAYGAAANQVGVWNQITSLGVTNGLLGLTGTATSESLNLSADSDAGAFGGTGDTGLLRGFNFFSSGGDPWSFTLSNLDNGTYSFYYYSPTNTTVRTGAFTVNGVLAPNILGNSTSTLNEGSDWEVVKGVSVTNGILSVASVDIDSARGLAGIQLVQTTSATPEPATLSLVAAMLGILWLVRLTTKRSNQASRV